MKQARERGMSSSNAGMPVAIRHRNQSGLLAVLPLLLWSCQATEPSANRAANEPGVLASGYEIPDGIAVMGKGEFLFADRGGAVYHYVEVARRQYETFLRQSAAAFTAGCWT
jgi:hypothetical protein